MKCENLNHMKIIILFISGVSVFYVILITLVLSLTLQISAFKSFCPNFFVLKSKLILKSLKKLFRLGMSIVQVRTSCSNNSF